MGMEIWFSVFTHNRFNLVKGFCSKFKLFESKSPQVILLVLFVPQDYFISFAFPFPSLWCSIQTILSLPKESCPLFFSAIVSFEPHLWMIVIAIFILFFCFYRILFTLNQLNNVFDISSETNEIIFMTSLFHGEQWLMLNIILKYRFFSSDNVLIRQNSHWTHFLKPKICPLKIIIVFASLQYFFHSPSLIPYSHHFWTVLSLNHFSRFPLKVIVKYPIFFPSCQTVQPLSLCFFNKSS